jgi:hypothetical protein
MVGFPGYARPERGSNGSGAIPEQGGRVAVFKISQEKPRLIPNNFK